MSDRTVDHLADVKAERDHLRTTLVEVATTLQRGIGDCPMPGCMSGGGFCGEDPCPHPEIAHPICICGGDAPCTDSGCTIGALLAKCEAAMKEGAA